MKKQSPKITAKSFCVTNATQDKIVLHKNKDSEMTLGRLTNLMTIFTAIKVLDKYKDLSIEDKITVNREATRVSGLLTQLLEGDIFTLK